jgi:hypothetical protein
VGRRALDRLKPVAEHDDRVREDGSIGYGGRAVSGKEADYVRAALGAKRAATTGAQDDLTFDESIEVLAAQLVKDGIGFSEWTRWTVDQMDVYLAGRKIRHEKLRETVEIIAQRARAEKADSMMRYSIPLE